MSVGLRCWPTNVDYHGKDSASVATFARDAAPCTVDLETHCSADSLQRLHDPPAASAPDSQAVRPLQSCGAAVSVWQLFCGRPDVMLLILYSLNFLPLILF
jgi:hypothetical protein